MNLIEEEVNYKKNKGSKIAKFLIALVILLIIAGIAVGVTIVYLQSEMLKFTIDGVAQTNYADDLFVFQNGKVYISLRDIAPLVGYKYHDGDYEQYSADKNKCYVDNADEVASFSVNDTKMDKIQPMQRDSDYEYFELEEPIRMINNKLYASSEGVSKGFNINFQYDQEKNSISISTLTSLVNYYTSQLGQKQTIAEDYNNQKAILYGMLVVVTDSKYGVIDLNGEEILGSRYKTIKYVESANEFIVTTTDSKVGIIDANRRVKISPQYDELKVLDKDLKLYLVKGNGKYGVVDSNGTYIAHLEYDEIGISNSSDFRNNDIKNQYLLFDNAIPVKKADKWGLIDRNGKVILPIEYDRIGSIEGTSSDKAANNLLLVPDYEGIVICKDKKYGLVNSQGTILILCQLDAVYSITNGGVNEYYMKYHDGTGEKTEDMIEFLNENYGSQTTNNEQTNTIVEENVINNNEINNTTVVNQVDQTNNIEQIGKH